MPLCLWQYQGLLSLLHFTGLPLGFQICPSLHAYTWAPIDIPLCMPTTVSQKTALYKDILCFEICSSQYAYICTSEDAPVYAYVSVLELLLYIYLDQGSAKIYAYIRIFKDAPLHM
jgi:hypothetical protein